MGEDPRDIERQIAQTRERMGETVEALAYKADVPSRVKGSVSDKKDAVVDKLSGAKRAIAGGTENATSRTGDMASSAGDGAKRAVGMAQENPLGLAVGGIAAGFLLGSLLPSTRVEEERLGPAASEMREQVSELASEAMEHGRQVAQEAASAATDAAQTAAERVKESGSEHAAQVAQSAKDSAKDSMPTSGSGDQTAELPVPASDPVVRS